MVALAVVLTLALCLAIDWWLGRRRPAAATSAPLPAVAAPVPVLSGPAYAGGFQLHEELSYHPGHAWALVEGPDRVRVGIDDFARRLIGRVEGLELPPVGALLQQGKEAWVLRRGARCAGMLAPISGQVVEINRPLLADPSLVARDPYGAGWLLTVRTTELRPNLNNLLSGRLVHRWLEDASSRLRARLHGTMGLSFADGGTAVADVGSLIDDPAWSAAVREFLLTSP